MRYAHPTPESMQRAVDKLGELFQKPRYYVGIPEIFESQKGSVSSLNLYN